MYQLTSVEPWAPHPSAAPCTAREGEELMISANGTRTCVGGWQLSYSGVELGQWVDLAVEVRGEALDPLRDHLQCVVYWEPMALDALHGANEWDYLLPEETTPGVLRFTRTLPAPAGATGLTLRYTFRWATTGRSTWAMPQIAAVAAPTPRPPVRVAVVTGAAYGHKWPETVAGNVEYYRHLCQAACREQPDLILLPEVCLQWGVPGNVLDVALPLDSPEACVFADLAREHHTRVALGLFERAGDVVYNTVALFGPDGVVEGTYHKVHLAVLGESDTGVLPGDTFPVYATEIGRIGFNICMDSSAAESARLVGLNGADFLLLPIMGDHRADRWSQGRPYFNEGRWQAIMRTRAMDNQLCMVVARNECHGSCIIDRKGDILAYNEGTKGYIVAEVTLEDGYRTWNGGCFREVNWIQRRPHLYTPFVDENNVGSLR